jgi:hypothetical protein
MNGANAVAASYGYCRPDPKKCTHCALHGCAREVSQPFNPDDDATHHDFVITTLIRFDIDAKNSW